MNNIREIKNDEFSVFASKEHFKCIMKNDVLRIMTSTNVDSEIQYRPFRLGFVVSQTNYDITFLMKERALDHADFLGVEVPYILDVPGAFEIPFAVQELLEKTDVDGVVTLGAIIKGETKHDEVIASHASRKIMDLSLEYGKPVSLGISGPGMSAAQAKARIESFATKAVESVVKLLQVQQDILFTVTEDEDKNENQNPSLEE